MWPFVYFGFSFFFSPPLFLLTFSSRRFLKGQGRLAAGLGAAACLWDVWSCSTGAGPGALASRGIGQILESGLRAAVRGVRSWRCRGLCCPEGIPESHSFALDAASWPPARWPPAPSPTLAPPPASVSPAPEVTAPAPAPPPLGAASSAWARILGAPSHRWHGWGPSEADFPRRCRQLLRTPSRCCLLLRFTPDIICSLAPCQRTSPSPPRSAFVQRGCGATRKTSGAWTGLDGAHAVGQQWAQLGGGRGWGPSPGGSPTPAQHLPAACRQRPLLTTNEPSQPTGAF